MSNYTQMLTKVTRIALPIPQIVKIKKIKNSNLKHSYWIYKGLLPASWLGVYVPGVSVLVTDLLLHLLVSEDLEERAPVVWLTLVPDGHLHHRQRRLTGDQIHTPNYTLNNGHVSRHVKECFVKYNTKINTFWSKKMVIIFEMLF